MKNYKLLLIFNIMLTYLKNHIITKTNFCYNVKSLQNRKSFFFIYIKANTPIIPTEFFKIFIFKKLNLNIQN